ncbi:MAG: helix-turn-helix transcriptional regulator [Crocinitomicaceae bacterium]
MYNDLGRVFRQLRELKGYSQEYVSIQMKISQKAYSKLERNETKMDWDKICSFSQIIGISPKRLLEFDAHSFFSPEVRSEKDIELAYAAKLEELYERKIAHLEEEIRFLRMKLA